MGRLKMVILGGFGEMPLYDIVHGVTLNFTTVVRWSTVYVVL
jgi:hypothetical protein